MAELDGHALCAVACRLLARQRREHFLELARGRGDELERHGDAVDLHGQTQLLQSAPVSRTSSTESVVSRGREGVWLPNVRDDREKERERSQTRDDAPVSARFADPSLFLRAQKPRARISHSKMLSLPNVGARAASDGASSSGTKRERLSSNAAAASILRGGHSNESRQREPPSKVTAIEAPAKVLFLESLSFGNPCFFEKKTSDPILPPREGKPLETTCTGVFLRILRERERESALSRVCIIAGAYVSGLLGYTYRDGLARPGGRGTLGPRLTLLESCARVGMIPSHTHTQS